MRTLRMMWRRDRDGRAFALVLAPLMAAGLLIAGLHTEPVPPLSVGPLRPATAEEERQWQLDQLAAEMCRDWPQACAEEGR